MTSGTVEKSTTPAAEEIVRDDQESKVEYDIKGTNSADVVTLSSQSSESDSDSIDKNPFLDPHIAEYYRSIYNDSNYECRAAFDPKFTWTADEEKKLVKKLDFRVALTSCILFVALQVDRGNLSQATADNFLVDLGMTTDDYNLGNTLFYVAFLVAEVPMSMFSKWLGPDVFIPFQIIGFSVVAFSQFWLRGKAGFLVCRVLLGWLEGSLIADLVVWLSYFYTAKELTIRLSWFWMTLSIVQILTSLLAFGILRMRGVLGYAGWRWLFLIEGLFTFLIGVAGFYLMVPSALQTRNRFHPKGWFNEREEKIVVNRVLRDDPSKGDMNNRQGITFRNLIKSLLDYDLWPIYVIGLLVYASMNTVTPYMNLAMKNVGFSTFTVNVLSIPANVLHIIFLLIITWFSERINERSFVGLIVCFYNLPILGVLSFWSGTNVKPWPTWALYSLIVGQPYIHAICVSWTSRNSNSLRTRSLSSALYNMFVQLGSVYGSNIYKASDAPRYFKGNRILFGLNLAMIPILLLTKAYYVWRNKQKEAAWSKLSAEERIEYLETHKEDGSKRLDFRFAH